MFLHTDLCLAVAWCCLHRCRWLWCLGRWWCCRWGSGWPWSPSSSSHLSQEAGAVLCGPRRAAAPGQHLAPHDLSVYCGTHRDISHIYNGVWIHNTLRVRFYLSKYHKNMCETVRCKLSSSPETENTFHLCILSSLLRISLPVFVDKHQPLNALRGSESLCCLQTVA